MPQTLKNICDPYAWIIIAILVAIVILQAAGMGLKPLIKAALRRLSGERAEVNVNIGETGDAMPKFGNPGGLIDPTHCPAHLALVQQGDRNEAEIKDIWKTFGELRKDMQAWFEQVKDSQSTLLEAIRATTAAASSAATAAAAAAAAVVTRDRS